MRNSIGPVAGLDCGHHRSPRRLALFIGDRVPTEVASESRRNLLDMVADDDSAIRSRDAAGHGSRRLPDRNDGHRPRERLMLEDGPYCLLGIDRVEGGGEYLQDRGPIRPITGETESHPSNATRRGR